MLLDIVIFFFLNYVDLLHDFYKYLDSDLLFIQIIVLIEISVDFTKISSRFI